MLAGVRLLGLLLVALGAVDGAQWLPAAGNGASTGFRPVGVGTHVVQVDVVSPVGPQLYTTVIGGACSAAGSIALAMNQKQVCTVTVIRQ